MRKIHYNKLIRDKIPEVIGKTGAQYEVRKLSGKEFESELLRKVAEEATGVAAARGKEELALEIADVLAVIEEIKKLKKISAASIRKAATANMKRKGGFKKRLYLAWAEDNGYRSNEKTTRK